MDTPLLHTADGAARDTIVQNWAAILPGKRVDTADEVAQVMLMLMVAIAKDVFGKRGVGSDQLPPASGELLPIDEAAEAQRTARVEQDVGPVAPGVVQYTSDVLFHDLWLRPALAPRDRSLVTVSWLCSESNAPTDHADAPESRCWRARKSRVHWHSEVP
jgi:alkylhydroperoxidase/carboxymuconolactone decarboxylase family protein YurZ